MRAWAIVNWTTERISEWRGAGWDEFAWRGGRLATFAAALGKNGIYIKSSATTRSSSHLGHYQAIVVVVVVVGQNH